MNERFIYRKVTAFYTIYIIHEQKTKHCALCTIINCLSSYLHAIYKFYNIWYKGSLVSCAASDGLEASSVAGVAAMDVSHLRREEAAVLLGPQHGLAQAESQHLTTLSQGGEVEPLESLVVGGVAGTQDDAQAALLDALHPSMLRLREAWMPDRRGVL